MITKIHNANDALLAFNENLEGLLTGKRKIPFVKEVNNTLGKACGVVKMQLIHKALTGDKTPMQWFTEPNQIHLDAQKKIKNVG